MCYGHLVRIIDKKIYLSWFSSIKVMVYSSKIIFLICLVTTCLSITNVPVIGVLTLPCNEDTQNCEMENITFNATTYLPASYIKWIEGGGAEIIPLLSDMDQTDMRNIISQINGILFTGGDAPFTSKDYYWNQILNILSYIRQYDDQHKREGYAIPVYGTCLGTNMFTFVATLSIIIFQDFRQLCVKQPKQE